MMIPKAAANQAAAGGIENQEPRIKKQELKQKKQIN